MTSLAASLHTIKDRQFVLSSREGDMTRDTRYKQERRDLQGRTKAEALCKEIMMEGINANLTQSRRLKGSHRRHMFTGCPLTS